MRVPHGQHLSVGYWVLPAKDRGDGRRHGHRVNPHRDGLHAVCNEQGDEGACCTRDVSLAHGDGLVAVEHLVQLVGHFESKLGQRRVVELQLRVEGEGVPGDVAAMHGCREVCHALCAGAVQPQLLVTVEVEVDQEGVCGEHQRLVQPEVVKLLHHVYCGWEVDVKVLVHDVGRSVGETHVEMARGH